jgi:hypothetical protein
MMRRILIALAIALGLIAPAHAVEMLNVAITTAITQTVGTTFQVRPGPGGQFLPSDITLQATWTYDSGGTTSDFWVQTSLDGGTSWVDIAHFGFNTASSTRSILNVLSAVAITTGQAATDGTFGTTGTVTAIAGGIFGNMWRVKYSTTGTYAGGTTIKIDPITSGLTTLP